MNSQFQKPPTGSKGSRSSAGDPPYVSGDLPAAQPSSPSVSSLPSRGSDASTKRTEGGGGAKVGGATRESASKGQPTGSEALLDETQDAIGAAADSVYAASGAVRDASTQIGDVAKEAMRATVSAVSAQAAELTSNITQELTATAEAQKERGTEAMHRLAKAIRTAAQELDDGSPEVASQIRAAAGTVDKLSDNLHTRSVGDLFNAATEFARSQPAAFFAGAVIAGFAFSRFLKSSSQPAAQPNGHQDEMPSPMSTSPQGVRPSAPSAATF